ncbi:hypothetical protein J8C06_13675 [Chloracidobacterium validum]|uniref:Uncharacterized protein n=1 Tax=Chloracidobacterium validum TaxID=2821543 RepID=A0ABX8BBQ6_9BACT|nr:hypothetical protein [Chloracidobacterium validum]QUW04096.1 hypothetical protein J8C06_13675 [Chloracidobacterium validum]
MPKKTKAQKLRAQQRQVVSERPVLTPAPDASTARSVWGRYLGLRFLLHVLPLDENHQDVALLCIDELRDGIIKVFFDRLTVEQLNQLMSDTPFRWLPADKLQCARVIAFGKRINDYIEKPPPDNFADFLKRFDDLPTVSLLPGVFFCPVLDDPLPSIYTEQIKKNALGGIDAYYISDRAQKKQLGARHPRYALPQHVRYRTAILESDRLTLRPAGWDTPVRAIASEGLEDAIGLAMTQDLVRGTIFSIERHLADATVPNPTILDEDVQEALNEALSATAAATEIPLDHASLTVAFVLQALDEGIALCKQIHRENTEREMDLAVVRRALETCLQNLRRPRGLTTGPRAYIDHLALTMR